ncbi:MAG: glycosyltransferase family 39 protein [Candidatus Zixiibacteriota bacterium]
MKIIPRIKNYLYNPENRPAIIIFFSAFILRILYLIIMLATNQSNSLINMFPDSIKYIEAGEYLLGIGGKGEFELFLVGPGYPIILGLTQILTGGNFVPLIFIQIILSSLTCVYIYNIALLILKNKSLAFISGLLVALSITSIGLANGILSETTFFFLFVLSVYLYLKAALHKKNNLFIHSGIIGGLAILIRSTTILFPFIFICIAILIPLALTPYKRKELIKNSLITALIMIIITLAWSSRNYFKYDVFTVSSTGAGAAKIYLAGMVNFTIEDRPKWQYKPVKDSIFNACLPDIKAGNFKKYYNDALEYVSSTFRKNPDYFIGQYYDAIVDNITIVSGLHFRQMPRYSEQFNNWELILYKGNNSSVVFVFSILGFLIIARKNLQIALMFLIIMLYFAVTSGVTFWQGSRIFYPAIITQSILVSATILFIYDLLILLKQLLFEKTQTQN